MRASNRAMNRRSAGAGVQRATPVASAMMLNSRKPLPMSRESFTKKLKPHSRWKKKNIANSLRNSLISGSNRVAE